MTVVIVLLLAAILVTKVLILRQLLKPGDTGWTVDADGALVNLAHVRSLALVAHDNQWAVAADFGNDLVVLVTALTDHEHADYQHRRLAVRVGAMAV